MSATAAQLNMQANKAHAQILQQATSWEQLYKNTCGHCSVAAAKAAIAAIATGCSFYACYSCDSSANDNLHTRPYTSCSRFDMLKKFLALHPMSSTVWSSPEDSSSLLELCQRD